MRRPERSRREPMDARTFDQWTVDITRRPTRRAALRLLAGGLLGGLLHQRAIALTRAAQRPDSDNDGLYDDDETNVYGTRPDVSDTDGDGVDDGEEIYNRDQGFDTPYNDPLNRGDVHCPGLASCMGICIDILTHPDHCGACFNPCPSGDFCVGGGCVASAPSSNLTCLAQGLTDCGGVCVDLSTNSGHCGACFNACQGADFCGGGACLRGCLALGSPCTYGVDECCGGACLYGVCQCSPSRDVCANGSTCCSGICGGDGFCV
jgi:hypothetical protein